MRQCAIHNHHNINNNSNIAKKQSHLTMCKIRREYIQKEKMCILANFLLSIRLHLLQYRFFFFFHSYRHQCVELFVSVYLILYRSILLAHIVWYRQISPRLNTQIMRIVCFRFVSFRSFVRCVSLSVWSFTNLLDIGCAVYVCENVCAYKNEPSSILSHRTHNIVNRRLLW